MCSTACFMEKEICIGNDIKRMLVLVRVVCFGAVLACCSIAQAGYYAVTYSGGQTVWTYWNGTSNVTVTDADSYDEYDDAYGCEIDGAVTSTSSGVMTATFTWTPSYSGDTQPAPQAGLVTETSDAVWSGGSGSCANGMMNPAVPDSGGGGAESWGQRFSAVVPAGASFNVTCSPQATGNNIPGATNLNTGYTYVAYAASAVGLRVAPTGVLNPGPSQSLLIGQKFGETVSCDSSYLVAGATYAWTISGGAPFAGYTANASSGQYTAWSSPNAAAMNCYFAQPSQVGPPTVPLTITVAATLPAFNNVTATLPLNLTVVAPTYTNPIVLGSSMSTLNSSNVPTTTNPTEFLLWNAVYGANTWGIWFVGTVTTPPQFVPLVPSSPPGNQWSWTQLITSKTCWVKTQYSSIYDSSDNFTTGAAKLDTNYPYSGWHPADGSQPTPPDSDAPGSRTFPLNPIELYVNDSFSLYQMYLPPGSTSLPVPLACCTWSCIGDTVLSSGVWSLSIPPSATQASAFSAFPSFPQWTANIGTSATWVLQP